MAAPKPKPGVRQLIRETVGGEPYEYYALGEHIVSAPGVCGGRLTFKYTRLEVKVVLDLLAAGWNVEAIAQEYRASRLSTEAVREAIALAANALVSSSLVMQLAA